MECLTDMISFGNNFNNLRKLLFNYNLIRQEVPMTYFDGSVAKRLQKTCLTVLLKGIMI
jgi:hypothetical protein